ncbi:MAG: extracellular solute-binding protein [Acidobacteriota bacterium]|jgi:iron(III) transport system substrate-binding protein
MSDHELLRPFRPRVLRGLTAAGVLALGLLGLLAAGCDDGRQQVVLYSPHGRDLLALLEETYEAGHPEIDVRWLDMGSQEVFDRIRSEKANPQADVWFGGPDTIFARGAEQGLLQPYRPAWAGSVPEGSRRPDELYFGVYRSMPVLVYNTAEVPADEAPRDWDDLLDPRWTDEILIRDPLASGTMRTMFGMILARSVAETGSPDRGFEWLRSLDAQTKEYVLNPALMIEKLARAEGLVTVWDLTDILLQQERGMPLDFAFPASGTPVIDDSIGLVAGAPSPEPAKAFIDWVGSPEAQRLAAERVYRVPARTDLPREELPAWARDVLDRLVPAELDWELIEERGPDWMTTWDRTVRGGA